MKCFDHKHMAGSYKIVRLSRGYLLDINGKIESSFQVSEEVTTFRAEANRTAS